MTSLNDTQIVAVNALRAHRSGPESERTNKLREVATAFVDAREHFFTPQGEPDWLGRTHAYRVWVRETMRLASIQPSELSTLQAAIRYHVGNIVRERMDSVALEHLGLTKSSPRERSIEKRGRNSEVLTIFGNGGHEITDADEIILMATMIDSALARVAVDVLAKLDAKRRKQVREALEGAEERLHALVAVAGSRRK